MLTNEQFDACRERMLRELASDMADLVASGDLTAEQANEWVNHKADQWTSQS
jgi:polyhydroxyalkanoate synthesis regulator phasin